MKLTLAAHPWTTLLAASAILLSTGRGRAQDVDPTKLAKAEALHEEAIAALEAKDYATACPKLERVVRLIPEGIGARLSLAECYEGSGRIASAMRTYIEVERAASAAAQRDRQKLARKKVADLEPRVGRLLIQVSEAARGAPDLRIRRGSTLIEPEAWGAPVPLDPGTYTIVAEATGKQRLRKSAEIKADGKTITVVIKELAEAPWDAPEEAAPAPAQPPPPSAPPLIEASPPPAPKPSPAPALSAPGWNSQQWAGVAVAGAGLATLGVGAFFGFRAMSKKSESEEGGHCRDDNRCDAAGFALREDAYNAGTVSTVLFIAGGVGLAGGATLFLTAPRRKGAEIALSPRGLFLRGRW